MGARGMRAGMVYGVRGEEEMRVMVGAGSGSSFRVDILSTQERSLIHLFTLHILFEHSKYHFQRLCTLCPPLKTY